MINRADPEEIKNKCKVLEQNLIKFIKAKIILAIGEDHKYYEMVGFTGQEFGFTLCIGIERYDSPDFKNPYFEADPQKRIRELYDWATAFADEVIAKHNGTFKGEDPNDSWKKRVRSTEWYF